MFGSRKLHGFALWYFVSTLDCSYTKVHLAEAKMASCFIQQTFSLQLVNVQNSSKTNGIVELSLNPGGILNSFCLTRMFLFGITCSRHFLILAVFCILVSVWNKYPSIIVIMVKLILTGKRKSPDPKSSQTLLLWNWWHVRSFRRSAGIHFPGNCVACP